MLAADQGFPGNTVIASVSARVRQDLLAVSRRVDLSFGDVLVEPGDGIRDVYFPTSCAISLITTLSEATLLEVGLVGSEGVHGASLALGVSASPVLALVQGPGEAIRMSALAFDIARKANPEFQSALNRYLYVLMAQFAHSAACSRFHLVGPRLARWLLMTQDRSGTSSFRMTHDLLAWTLGLSRPVVTLAANSLQRGGLISYRRGQVTVLDRDGLESAACSCYRADLAVYEDVFPPLRDGSHVGATELTRDVAVDGRHAAR